jgi:TPR repeat protein
MTYIENRDTRDTLICYLGEEAYVRYDDSAFKLQYQSLWNATTYREIAAHLYGMNWKQIDWAEAQEMTSNANQDDAIIIGFKALLLHPEVFSSNRLHKDEDASRLEWKRAEELGLSILADADNPNAWAQWIKGIHLDIVEQDYDVAKSLYRLAAEQGLALAQNSLGALYQDDELDDLAESYYEQASLQGHALAQYNLAVLCEEEGDLNRAQEYFQQAAAQGHIEAREAIENLSEGTDMEQVHE